MDDSEHPASSPVSEPTQVCAESHVAIGIFLREFDNRIDLYVWYFVWSFHRLCWKDQHMDTGQYEDYHYRGVSENGIHGFSFILKKI